MSIVGFPKDVLAQIKTYLERKDKDTEKKLKDLASEDPFEDNSRLLDRASDDTEAQSKAGHERVAALQRQMSLALVQTRKALTKIKIGKYGNFENCGKKIDTDRLAAMPTATLCVNCERKREK
ncbi:TraR/DksA C4-type zinc finger protein [Candidatus Microgenomates bacterium]|nr:TraR/DksA C4-type zinc finger protein [Candidatus Microgenomates bacterium]